MIGEIDEMHEWPIPKCVTEEIANRIKKEFHVPVYIDLDAVTTTGVYHPKEAEKPKDKMYLTTHNPYMSKDWKRFFDELIKANPHLKYFDTDVMSLYPAYYVPARGSAKTDPLTKELLRQMSNRVYGRTPAQNQLKVKLESKRLCDALDAARYSFEAFRVAMERIDEAQKEAIAKSELVRYSPSKQLYEVGKLAAKSFNEGVLKVHEDAAFDAMRYSWNTLIEDYCRADVKACMDIYNDRKEKGEDTYDWMAHSPDEIIRDMQTILNRRKCAERYFDHDEWVWELSSDIMRKLSSLIDHVFRPGNPDEPSQIFSIYVRPVRNKTNHIKLVRKVKEEEKDMGLQDDLCATNGYATIKVNGHEYNIRVTEVEERYGEPVEIKAYVPEPWALRRLRKPQNPMIYYTPQIKDVKFEDPAVIVFWADGTKTVVRAQDEAYDPEKGLAMAISRKALGNKRDYYHVFLKWLKKFKKKADTVKLYADDQVVAELPVSTAKELHTKDPNCTGYCGNCCPASTGDISKAGYGCKDCNQYKMKFEK